MHDIFLAHRRATFGSSSLETPSIYSRISSLSITSASRTLCLRYYCDGICTFPFSQERRRKRKAGARLCHRPHGPGNRGDSRLVCVASTHRMSGVSVCVICRSPRTRGSLRRVRRVDSQLLRDPRCKNVPSGRRVLICTDTGWGRCGNNRPHNASRGSDSRPERRDVPDILAGSKRVRLLCEIPPRTRFATLPSPVLGSLPSSDRQLETSVSTCLPAAQSPQSLSCSTLRAPSPPRV